LDWGTKAWFTARSGLYHNIRLGLGAMQTEDAPAAGNRGLPGGIPLSSRRNGAALEHFQEEWTPVCR
jgi:hypothetical protein